MKVVVSRRWRPDARSYAELANDVARAAPDAVFLSGLLDTNGGRVIKDLRSRSSAHAVAAARRPQ
jgi:hypothetical protein